MEDILAGVTPDDDEEWFDSAEALAQPLLACYWSLWECGETLPCSVLCPSCMLKTSAISMHPENYMKGLMTLLIGRACDWHENDQVCKYNCH